MADGVYQLFPDDRANRLYRLLVEATDRESTTRSERVRLLSRGRIQALVAALEVVAGAECEVIEARALEDADELRRDFTDARG